MLEARYTACNEEPTWKCRPRDDLFIQKADIVCSPCLLALSTDRCLFFHNRSGLHARLLPCPSASHAFILLWPYGATPRRPACRRGARVLESDVDPHATALIA